MSTHVMAHAHAPVGGHVMTRGFRILLAIAAIGGLAALYRFVFGLGAVSNLNDGYPWGIWISFDVVTGTALGCGGYAVALLVYILNQGKYHPLIRPAVLTSLLGYGLAIVAVTVDLGRFWSLWKVPIFYWRWTHSPQLEVALCVAAYTLGRALLSVDVHVHRVACRLGWAAKGRPEQAHAELEALVPAPLRHPLHVTAVAHGRACCRALRPACPRCPIVDHCRFARRLGGEVASALAVP